MRHRGWTVFQMPSAPWVASSRPIALLRSRLRGTSSQETFSSSSSDGSSHSEVVRRGSRGLEACSPTLLVAGQGSRRRLPDTCLLRCRSRSASAGLVLPPQRRRELWSPLATDGVDPSRFVKFLWLLCTRVSCCCRDRCTDAATGHPDETTGGEQKPRGRAVLASNVPWQLPVQVQPGSIGELCL